MRHDEYAKHVEKFTSEMREVTKEKNADYSAGTDDAMNDYRSASVRCGVTPVQAWGVLLMKHVHAVERFLKTGQLSSESIHSRLIDLANYAMLGDALVKDLEERKPEKTVDETELQKDLRPVTESYGRRCKVCKLALVHDRNESGVCPDCVDKEGSV